MESSSAPAGQTQPCEYGRRRSQSGRQNVAVSFQASRGTKSIRRSLADRSSFCARMAISCGHTASSRLHSAARCRLSSSTVPYTRDSATARWRIRQQLATGVSRTQNTISRFAAPALPCRGTNSMPRSRRSCLRRDSVLLVRLTASSAHLPKNLNSSFQAPQRETPPPEEGTCFSVSSEQLHLLSSDC